MLAVEIQEKEPSGAVEITVESCDPSMVQESCHGFAPALDGETVLLTGPPGTAERLSSVANRWRHGES